MPIFTIEHVVEIDDVIFNIVNTDSISNSIYEILLRM